MIIAKATERTQWTVADANLAAAGRWPEILTTLGSIPAGRMRRQGVVVGVIRAAVICLRRHSGTAQ